ncbi:C-C chemokine receptor type 10 [Leptodactylus fuscus]|uniref:C-C chemokine receptor type 10 n=1 Tax=Leptodactylus fuscus TaxID=238119 RepID=UPI003F4E5B43
MKSDELYDKFLKLKPDRSSVLLDLGFGRSTHLAAKPHSSEPNQSMKAMVESLWSESEEDFGAEVHLKSLLTFHRLKEPLQDCADVPRTPPCSSAGPLLSTLKYMDYTTDYVSADYDIEIPEICDVNNIKEFNKVFQPCIQCLVFLIGIFGNTLVLLTYGFAKRIKSMTDIYLINLAVADLLLLLTLPFMSVSAVNGWVFGNSICKVVQGMYAINFFSGFLFLTCISVDRYIEIVQAVQALKMRQRSIRYSRLISLSLWLVSVLLSLPELLYSQSKLHDGSYICKMIFPEEVTSTVQSISNIFQIILGFFVPFFVMVFCYIYITKTLLTSKNFRKHKALKVIISIVVVFLIFQLPYTVITFMDTADLLGNHQMPCDVRKKKDIAIIITSNLAFTRCCLNPIIYVFVGVNFRKEIFLLLKNFGCISRATYVRRYGSNRDSATMDTNSFTL